MKHPNWLLILLLIIGAILRFYGFPNIPFTYDELSAWGRTDYNSFTDLINKGVRGDGHPALIQIFLYYWRKIFGDSEASFKLPFLLMGVACIYLVYEIGKQWFNETVGLLSAAFITALQYTVMYSQIARPYISGLFFTLMMVLYWTKYVFADEEKRKWRTLVGFIVFAALSFYDHYFSLLFACIVAFSGYFFLPRKLWKEYSAACVMIPLLFSPHIGITLAQFKIGGVGGWLAKPDFHFFQKYLSYSFDFSWWVRGVVAALVLVSFIFIAKEWRKKNKLRLLCLAWFLLPLLIGYFYSKYYNPVLQYSVLIFSFPYLLIFLFSLYKDMNTILKSSLVAAILIAGLYSLIFERKHYELFYKQPVEQMVKYSVDFVNQHPGKRTWIEIQEPSKYMSYYLKKWNSNIIIHSYNDSLIQDCIASQKMVRQENPDYVLCGNIPYDQLRLFRNSFPKTIDVQKGFTYDFFAFAKENEPGPGLNEVNYTTSINFSDTNRMWNYNPAFVKKDSSGKTFYQMDSSQEFGPGLTTDIHSIMKERDDYLVLDAEVSDVKPGSKGSLVLTFSNNGPVLFWQEKPFSYFIDSSGKGHVVNSFAFRDFNFTKADPQLKFYLWNRDHQSFKIHSMTVEVMKGNPIIYSMIEPVPPSAK